LTERVDTVANVHPEENSTGEVHRTTFHWLKPISVKPPDYQKQYYNTLSDQNLLYFKHLSKLKKHT